MQRVALSFWVSALPSPIFGQNVEHRSVNSRRANLQLLSLTSERAASTHRWKAATSAQNGNKGSVSGWASFFYYFYSFSFFLEISLRGPPAASPWHLPTFPLQRRVCAADYEEQIFSESK